MSAIRCPFPLRGGSGWALLSLPISLVRSAGVSWEWKRPGGLPGLQNQSRGRLRVPGWVRLPCTPAPQPLGATPRVTVTVRSVEPRATVSVM
jgi:hypothetical protein